MFLGMFRSFDPIVFLFAPVFLVQYLDDMLIGLAGGIVIAALSFAVRRLRTGVNAGTSARK